MKNFKEIKLDVIIVDDNSQDKTLEKASQFHTRIDLKILKNKKNLGLGYTGQMDTTYQILNL